jgi:hypothetical protein
MNPTRVFQYHGFQQGGLVLLIISLFWMGGAFASTLSNPMIEKRENLRLAKVYLAAGDFRRAVLACQQEINEAPSVESYVYLTYVYHSIDGYLQWLASKDEWNKVAQLSLGLTTRGTFDLVDPVDSMARMAKEMIGEGVRQQFDLTADMANRLDRSIVDRMWVEQTKWKEANPEQWWNGVPPEWNW